MSFQELLKNFLKKDNCHKKSQIWDTISNVENGKSVLHGVTSFSTGGCGNKEFPGMVFANVYAMKGFIEDVLVRFPYFSSEIYPPIPSGIELGSNTPLFGTT